MATKTLQDARKNKADEFYTQLADIENELKHYKTQFKNKIVFCNCDDPYESNFFKYFAMNFNYLGLKKLIATCYSGSPIASTQLSIFDCDDIIHKTKDKKNAHKIVITQVNDLNKDGATDLVDIELLLKNDDNALSLLNGNGDFRSEECIELLKQADIVVTNPPFSLFREYVAQLIKFDKKFLIIGNQNNLTYKEMFNYIKNNLLWLGYHSGDMAFKVPQNYKEKTTRFWIDEKGEKWRSFGNICWYTNLDTTKRHEIITLYKKYNEQEYQKFDNYNAINVDKITDIPYDYNDIMGVPITFLDKYNPSQFEILDCNDIRKSHMRIKNYGLIKDKDSSIKGKPKYARIVIRRKNEN